MRPIAAAAVCAILVSCSTPSPETDRIARAVDAQLSLYPESTLQDLYKSFAQAEFGPGHMIADTASAGLYLDYELEEADSTGILFEPVGADSSYFRVHLASVRSGRITRDELLNAFLESTASQEETSLWPDKWHLIEKVIESRRPGLVSGNPDSLLIDSILLTGNYAVHHSRLFNRLYRPHYRIVRKDIFLDRLYGRLK